MKTALLLSAFFLYCSAARAEESAAARPPKPAWQAELEKSLDGALTEDIPECSADEALENVRRITRASIVIDSQLTFSDRTRFINFSLELKKGDTARSVLEKITTQGDFETLFVDHALFLFPKGKYAHRPPESAPFDGEALKKFKLALPDLNSADFEAREKASTLIRSFGLLAVPRIEEALKTETEAESRQRLKSILEFYAPTRLNDVTPDVAQALEKLTTRTTFEFADTSLKEALALLPAIPEKARITCDAKVENQNLSLRIIGMPFGDALKWIARASGTKIEMKDEAFHFTAATFNEK